jgi:predicted dehydrogenase
MSNRLRVGVIGLGRRWQRYLPALAGLRRHLEVSGVCDQVARLAERTANRIGCSHAAGAVDLLERDDVNAVLLLDRQWYGLWPMQQACRLGKPVYCALSLLHEPEVDALHEQVQASRLPVLMSSSPVLSPALLRLRQLLGQNLGPPRLLRVERSLPRLPRPMREGLPPMLGSTALLGMLQICSALFQGKPVSVWTVEADHSPLLSLMLEFGADRVAQLNLWIDPARPPFCRVRVVAEHGQAEVLLPRRLSWREREGQHRQKWPRQPYARPLLYRFAAAVAGGQPVQPSFQEAYHALLWWRSACQSLAERRRVLLTPEEPWHE